MQRRALGQCGMPRIDVSSHGMKISEIRVLGLFNAFNHQIRINNADRITIIHGSNGVGKTTVLKMIDDIFHSRFVSLRRVPFDEVVIGFESGSELHILRSEKIDDDTGRQLAELHAFEKRADSSVTKSINLSATKKSAHVPASFLENRFESLSRLGPGEWYDGEFDDVLDYEGVLERYGEHIPGLEKPKYPKWLDEVLSLDVLMIETQRLSAHAVEPSRAPYPVRPGRPGRPGRRSSSAVDLLAGDLINQIRVSLATYAEASQSLDRTFPLRLLSRARQADQNATPEEIRRRYENQSTTRTKLIAAGLIDQSEPLQLPDKELNDTEAHVLWTYLNDVDEKLRVLEPMSDKIDLFLEILNNKYQATNKAIRVDRQDGFVIQTEANRNLEPRLLSSGEQHELVLAYRLIFQVKPDSLILIDEPELSLHPAWQQVFIDDLERISETSKLDFVLATHSPVLIGRRYDLTVSLATDGELIL